MYMRVLIFSLMFIGMNCQLKLQLSRHISNMIRSSSSIDNLVNWGHVFGHHYHRVINPSQISQACGKREFLPKVWSPVKPFELLEVLQFGDKTKAKALQISNQIGATGQGRIVTNAVIGVRIGNSIEMVSAYGVAVVTTNQQFETTRQWKCKKFLFWERCGYLMCRSQ